jgi:hypothetical protein
MSQSRTKLLVSGCGITYTGQPARTWATILKLAGVDVIDVSGPAVSNQWIVNRAFMKLQQDPEIKHAIIQLTALGKLDVEVDLVRELALVRSDSTRNFVVDGVWPSSTSIEHPAKSAWREMLFSPRLEQQDLEVKLTLLQEWCTQRDIQLLVVQGYDMHWHNQDEMNSIIDNIEWNIMSDYQQTKWFRLDSEKDVPVTEYQFELAIHLMQRILPSYTNKLQKIYQQYLTCRRVD